MNSNDAIVEGFIPYPYTFPALQFTVWTDSENDDKDLDAIDEWQETQKGGE